MKTIHCLPPRQDSSSASKTYQRLALVSTFLLALLGCSEKLEPSDLSTTATTSLSIRIAASADDAEERKNGRTNLNSSDLEMVYNRGGEQTVGLRFTDVAVPQNATVTKAYIQFTADETSSVETSLVFQAEASGDASPLSSEKDGLSTRATTEAAITWAPEPWTQPGAAGPLQQSSDVSSVLQEIVDRPDWAAGHALVFLISGTGERIAESFDGTPDAAPLLFVEYSTDSTSTNQAPTADAGPDQSVALADGVTLAGKATDDGLPNDTLTTLWSKVSGPGTVGFADASALNTTATFSAPGDYVLKLTANDGALTATDTVTVTVAEAPVSGITVSISPSSANLQTGQTTSFTALVSGTDVTGVVWSTSGGTFSGTGNTVTYTASDTAGTYTLTATSVADESKQAVANISVSAPPSSTSVTIAAAGDIACDPSSSSFNGGNGTSTMCHMKATSDLLLAIKPDAVLTLGDNQYENGTFDKFQKSYDLSWGRAKSITRPSVGNHEYHISGATGYFQYFGSAAGDPAKGYYSYDLGAWHIIALNSNCSKVGGCGSGSAQEKWLRADLAANPTACTLAYWHHPRFSSGDHGNNSFMAPIWQALYDAGAEVVLSGHDHSYERFAPQTASGGKDTAQGIRQFVVGTGGKTHYAIDGANANSEARNDDTYGVLELTLNADSYAWQFLPEAGKSFTDSGSGSCH